jgi:alkaline phosphatase
LALADGLDRVQRGGELLRRVGLIAGAILIAAGWASPDRALAEANAGSPTPIEAESPSMAQTSATPTSGRRNVILIIGDGMDDNQISLARNYLKGARGRLTLDGMPVRSAVQVLTVAEDDPSRALYVADSANSATAMASGTVTSRGRISTTPGTDEDVTTILELAEAAGMRTGIVTTSSVTDATPAAFVAHINARMCENPAAMVDVEIMGIPVADCSQDLKSNGGLGSISEQIIASGVDVVLGGGAMHFAPMIEGGTLSVSDEAARLGYHVIGDADALASSPRDKKLLGLFSEKTMPVRMRSQDGREAEKPDPSMLNSIHWYLGSVELPEPMKCEPDPEFAGMPSLKAMSEAALEHLAADEEHGFFLMIESASIDKQAHARKPCGSIGELEQLEEALRSALSFAAEHPETLILVTSDHGQAAQIIPDESLFSAFGAPVFTPGHLVRLQLPDGSIMAVNYATNEFMLEEHTGVNVPLFANDAGREIVAPMLAQPEIFTIMRTHLGL